jgi:hypothetical protein
MKAEKHDARTVCLVESASGKQEAWFQDEVPVGAVVVMCMSFGEYTRIRREEEARLLDPVGQASRRNTKN